MAKVEFTLKRSALALVPPRSLEEKLSHIFSLADKRDGGYITIKVSNVHRPRSTGEKSQNRHINGHIQQIARDTGNAFEVVKLEAKHRAISLGYPMLIIDGKVQTDLWGRPMGISEADASVEEASLLIEAIHQLGYDIFGYDYRFEEGHEDE